MEKATRQLNPWKRSFDSASVALLGDMAGPNFGFLEDKYRVLFREEKDLIVHAGGSRY
jgi:thioester reductase-like protein